MTTPTVSLHFTVQQGATFRQRFQRFQVPADVVLRNGALLYKASGKPVPSADRVPVDYTGCTAVLQLRSGESELAVTFSTSPEAGQGSITLDDRGQCELLLTAQQTAGLNFSQCGDLVGPLDVTFSNGDVERQFLVHLSLEPVAGCHG